MTLFIDVITRDLANPDKPADRNRINYDRPQSRAWLAQHASWALRNNHSVTTAPIEGSNEHE